MPGLFDDVQVTINVTDVNDAPTTNDVSVNAVEGVSSVAVVLTGGDVDGTVSSFKINGLPTGGTLYSDAALTHAIASGATVSAAGNSATVYFKPTTANSNGTSTFQYEAVDNNGTHDASPATATIAIASVNDAPAGADKTFSIAEDTGKSFSAADFGFSDTHDSNSLLSVTITSLPTAGALLLNGIAVAAGQAILASDLSDLKFEPYPNENGTGYASFTFQVTDNGGTSNGGVNTDPTANTITFDVTAQNDAPVIWAPSSFNFVPASSSTGDMLTTLNTLKFADINSAGSVTVKLTTSDSGAHFLASSGGGVSVSGNDTGTLTLTGTIAAINTFIADNHLAYDLNDNSADTITVSINDGSSSNATDSATIIVGPNAVGSPGEDLPDSDTFNVHQTTIDLGNSTDSIVTGWNHLGTSATTYEAGAGLIPSAWCSPGIS